MNRGQTARLTFRRYHESGLPLAEIWRSATVTASELLGLQAPLGTIEPGKHADLIGVTGDPYSDATSFDRITFVMKSGKIVKP